LQLLEVGVHSLIFSIGLAGVHIYGRRYFHPTFHCHLFLAQHSGVQHDPRGTSTVTESSKQLPQRAHNTQEPTVLLWNLEVGTRQSMQKLVVINKSKVGNTKSAKLFL